MDRLAIIGAGDLGEQVLHYSILTGINVVGFIDDTASVGTEKHGEKVLGGINEVNQLFSEGVFTHVIIAIGYKHFEWKSTLLEKLENLNIPLMTVIAPNCYIDNTSILGAGSFIMPGTIIDQKAKVGKAAVINCNCTLSHDSILGDNVFLGPGVTISGFVVIGNESFLGSGSTCVDNITVGSGVLLGAGAVLTESVYEKGLYVGVPADKK